MEDLFTREAVDSILAALAADSLDIETVDAIMAVEDGND